MKHRRLFLLLPLLGLLGCEKDINIRLNDVAPKLVVEATIENDQPPLVILSRSLSYFSTITPQQLAASFVHGARVDVSDGTRTHRLREYTIPVGNGYSVSYYTLDSSSLSTAIIGALRTRYSLRIETDSMVYTAATSIPGITKRIDTMWWRPGIPDSSEGRVQVMVKATDPPGFGDYVRYWTRRNRERFLPGSNSVFDDLVIDGTTYDLPIDPGVDRTSDRPESWNERTFRRGDTVTLKLANIDRATFEFWRTMEYTYQSVGNPFSSPTRVLGNISNGALGYFGGYAAQYRTVIVPR